VAPADESGAAPTEPTEDENAAAAPGTSGATPEAEVAIAPEAPAPTNP
jgi:hypothetical protein